MTVSAGVPTNAFEKFSYKCRDCDVPIIVTEITDLEIGDYSTFDGTGGDGLYVLCPTCGKDARTPSDIERKYMELVKAIKANKLDPKIFASSSVEIKHNHPVSRPIDPWADFMSQGEGATSQTQIRALYKDTMARLDKARALQKMAISQLDMLREMCKHPNKKRYICPDCGYDNSPDGY
jgi:hypothetical protein